MLVLLLLALSSVEAVKKPSSLFEAYAMAPYGYYYPAYAPFPPQPGYAPPPPQLGYAGPPAQPGYAGPPAFAYQRGPQGPPGYFPGYMQPPSQGYYDPRYGMQFSYDQRPVAAAEQRPSVQQVQEPAAAPAVTAEAQVEPVRRIAKFEQTVETTPSPLKAALSEALKEATKEIDKANAQAATRMVSFDNLDYSPRRNPPPTSLSEESVPIDDHILNWRELVGIRGSNGVNAPQNPVNEDGVTPLLAGHMSERLR